MAKFIDLDTGLPALLNKVKAWVNSKTEDFITAEDAAGIVAATGDLVIVERDNYIDILITESQVNITPASLALYAAQKSAVIKVSGTHLKNDISISVPTGFTASPSTIAQVDGTVAQTDVTITYTGADASTASGNITATAGDVVKSIPVAYSQYAGPTILADSTLTIKAAAGQSNTGSLQVTGLNLTAGINATVSGTGFTVSSSENGTYGNQASLPSSGGTLYVKFSPTGSTASTGTLTLESTGATNKTVTLTGAVAGTLSISPSSASIGIVSDGSGTAQFTVTGANLTPASTATVEISGTGMSADKQTLTVGQDGTINEVVTVTFSGSADSNGTLTVSHTDVDNDATASIAGSIVTPLAEGTVFRKGDLLYTVLSGQTTVSVKQVKVASGVNIPSGAVVIPATISDENATESDGTTPITGASGMTYNVTEVAAQAFNSNSGVTSLVIPEGVTKIGANAFYGNSANKLANINIPSTCTTFVATSGGVNDGPRNMIVFAAGSTINMALKSIWSNSLDSVVVLTAYTSGMSLTDFPKFNKSTSNTGSFLQKSNGGLFGSSNVNTTLYVPDQATKTFLEGSGDAAYNNFAGGIKLISELSQSDKDYINSL